MAKRASKKRPQAPAKEPEPAAVEPEAVVKDDAKGAVKKASAKKAAVKKGGSAPPWWRRLLFWKRDRIVDDLKKVEKLSEKDQRRKDLTERLFSMTAQRKKKVPRRKRKLQELLSKAGLEISPSEFKKRVFLVSIILSLVLSLVVLLMASINGRGILDILVFMAGFWTAGFILILLLAALFSAAFLDVRIHQRKQQVEAVLPDYLQLAAANIGAGMTIDKALWYAVRPRFGVLASEMEEVAKEVLAGRELNEALRDFSERYESPVVERSVSLLLEGIAAGGKVADLLHKISTDIQEQRILQQEMSANVTTYVIFITFAAIIAAPVLFGLATQLLVVIQEIAGGIGTGGGGGIASSLSVSPDVIRLGDFKLFSVLVLIGTSLISGLIVSVIKRGDVFDGLRYLPFFVVISLSLYFMAVFFFGLMFGGLI